MRYHILHNTICEGWINTWTEEKNGVSTPLTFATLDEAEIELDEFLLDTQKAFDDGELDSPYDREEFRIEAIKD